MTLLLLANKPLTSTIGHVGTVAPVSFGAVASFAFSTVSASAGNVHVSYFAYKKGTKPTITAPSGWTILTGDQYDSGGGIGVVVAYKVATGGVENGTWTTSATVTNATITTSTYSGVDNTSPFRKWQYREELNSNTIHRMPELNVDVDGSWVVAASTSASGYTFVPASPLVERADGGSAGSITIGTADTNGPVWQGYKNYTITTDTTTSSSAQFVGALRATGVADPSSITLYSANGPITKPINADAVVDPLSTNWTYVGGEVSVHTQEFAANKFIAKSTDSKYTVVPTMTGSWGPNPFLGVNPIPIPDNAAPATGSDGWMNIVDPAAGKVYSLYEAVKTNGVWSSTWGAVYPYPSHGSDRDEDGTVIATGFGNGAGMNIHAGVITVEEMEEVNKHSVAEIIAGDYIPHALTFIGNFAATTGVRWPATKTDGLNISGETNPVPEGTRMRLKPSVNLASFPNISKAEAAIAKAFQKYGGYLVDNGGGATPRGRLAFYMEGQALGDPARTPPTVPGSNTREGGVYHNSGLIGDYQIFTGVTWNGNIEAISSWDSSAAGGTTSKSASDTSSISINDVPVYPDVSTITEDFASLNTTTKWTATGANPPTVSGGQLIVPAQNQDTAYAFLNTKRPYNIVNSQISTELVSIAPNTHSSIETIWGLREKDGPNNGDAHVAIFIISNGSMRIRHRASFTDNDTVITYDSVAHRWLRIGVSGTTMNFDTSPDGSTWTNRKTLTTTIPILNRMYPFYSAGFYVGGVTGAGNAVFDNLNLITTTVPVSASDTASLTISETSAPSLTVSTSDTASVSIADSSSSVITMTRADTASVTIGDASTSASTLSAADTASITITEARTLAGSSTSTDTSAITIGDASSSTLFVSTTDTSSISVGESPISNSTSVSASDVASVSIADSSSSTSTISTTDTAALTIADTSSATSNTLASASDTSSVSIADASQSTISMTRTDTASITITETSSPLVSLTASDTAALTITDASTSLTTMTSTDTAAITITDTSAVFVTLSASDTSSISVGESPVGAGTSVTGTDLASLIISDSSSSFITVATTDTASVSIADSSALLQNIIVSASDTASVSIAETSAVAGTVTTTDTSAVTITESTSSTLGITGTDTAALTISDASASSSTIIATDISSVAIGDGSAVQALLTLSASDSAAVTISDSSAPSVSLSANDTASITISDSSASALTLSRPDTAAVTITETALIASSQSTTDTSSISIADSSIVLSFSALSASDTSSVSIAETASEASYTLTSDTAAVSIADSSAVQAQRSTTDTAALTITEATATTNIVTASDTSAVSVGESSGGSLTPAGSDTASVSINDTSSSLIAVSTSDTSSITISESNTFAKFITASDTASITITESRATQMGFSTTDTAALTITEARSLASTLSRTDTAAITISETNVQTVSLSRTDTAALSIDDAGTKKDLGAFILRARVGGTWVIGILKVYKNGAWTTPLVKIRQSGAWR